MKILIVYKEDYPWDVRVEKLIDALAEDGHRVFIASNNFQRMAANDYLGAHPIRRLPALGWLPTPVANLLKLPLWFNPLWYFLFHSLAREHQFDAVIIRDLPLLKLAVLAKNRYRFRVVYDMAEVYPEMYQSIRDFGKFNIKDYLLKNPRMAARYETNVIDRVDHTFAMVEESRDRLLARHVAPHRISIVSNTPPVAKYHGAVMAHTGRALRLLYVGRLTRLRGLDILIRAIHEFLRTGHPTHAIQLDVVGIGPVTEDLRRLVNSLDIRHCVYIHGWLEQKEVNALMTSANVGVATYRVCGHWNHTIPNKIFDYMLAGMPVLATPVTTIGRIVTDKRCGIVTSTESPEELAAALAQLSDPQLRQRLGNNGYRAILEDYNWETDKKEIQSVMQQFTYPPDYQT